jgi:hypothetical protein
LSYNKYALKVIFSFTIMPWEVQFHRAFEPEFDALPPEVQDVLLAKALLLEEFGPFLGRPSVDSLKGSSHSNLKELRFLAGEGVWRVAFGFDPLRNAILLVAGDKSGGSQKLFYKRLIEKADQRFMEHLEQVKLEAIDDHSQTKTRNPNQRTPKQR